MLEIEQLTKRFGGLSAVSAVTFDVPSSRVTGLIGPNGAGKTTIFNIISGFLRPDAGLVRFAGKVVTGWPPDRIAGLGLGRTFQNVQLFPNMNVLENVMVARYCRTHSGLLDALFCLKRDRVERRQMVEQAVKLLDWIGLHDKRLRMPRELPYGDQRRVEIARALATDPRLLILDEPTAGMVAKEAEDIVELLGRLTEAGITILLIEHNMSVVMSVSHKIVVVNNGVKIAEGTPSEVQNNSQVIEAYLGRET